ncbi:phosphotransferase enzyme family protein [Billgrantia saliphila]|uniref:phosphotransferase enzyme family protein n=1 Tax=Billgrantia saliphila TaxID=1848458 RepID=UPI000CE2E009|nr:phosphotransferase [Halomonas saliphila]
MRDPLPIDPMRIDQWLSIEYDLSLGDIEPLGLGADLDARTYRLVDRKGTEFFLKLRRGRPDPATLSVPQWLANQGLAHVVAPLATRTGELWAKFGSLHAVLYPFVEGHSGWQVELTPGQWRTLGKTLRSVHEATLPHTLLQRLPRETYSPVWRQRVAAWLARLPAVTSGSEPGRRMIGLLKRQQSVIRHIVDRATALAGELRRQDLPCCLCHGDLHAGNVLVSNERLALIDWDTLWLAPRERDLMFIGGGVGGNWNREEEKAWFQSGYGEYAPNPTAVSYYRLERIVQDIDEFCAACLDEDPAASDPHELYDMFAMQFEPGNVVEIALATDGSLRAER